MFCLVSLSCLYYTIESYSLLYRPLLIFLNIRLLFSSLISHQIVAQHTAENLRGQAARKRVNNSSSSSSVNMIFFGENSRKVLKSARNIRSCASIKTYYIFHLLCLCSFIKSWMMMTIETDMVTQVNLDSLFLLHSRHICCRRTHS